jgi:hypothetical protein
MAAAHLVDRVLPEVPIRQWVLSLPYTLRYRMAYDSRLVGDIHRIFVQAIFGTLRRRTGIGCKSRRAKCGAVTFTQRFGDALNLNLHFHMLALDGVYVEDDRLYPFSLGIASQRSGSGTCHGAHCVPHRKADGPLWACTSMRFL